MFPSPCGDYGSYQLKSLYEGDEDTLFPSPCGDYGSYRATVKGKEDTNVIFPSPCGDYGSYHGEQNRLPDDTKVFFPSPCGDYGSYRFKELHDFFFEGFVFRPLAGIMVLISIPS